MTTPTTAVAKGPLPRGRMTPECRTGADRWPDLHELCHAPGYQDRVLGWVAVPCCCTCHTPSTSMTPAETGGVHDQHTHHPDGRPAAPGPTT